MDSYTRQQLIAIIGSAESSIAADLERQSLAESICRDLRKLLGLNQRAIVRWEDGRWRVITAKKAIARAERKGAHV